MYEGARNYARRIIYSFVPRQSSFVSVYSAIYKLLRVYVDITGLCNAITLPDVVAIDARRLINKWENDHSLTAAQYLYVYFH